MVWQNDPEFAKYVNWTINKATKYPVDCVGCAAGTTVFPGLTNPSLLLPLVAPGSRYNDRLNQVDVGIKRTFKFRESMRLQLQLDVFNVNNAHTVLVETQNLGSRLSPAPGTVGPDYRVGGAGGTPTQILQARLLRLALQFHF